MLRKKVLSAVAALPLMMAATSPVWSAAPTATTPITPDGSSSSSTPVFEWSAVDGATWYRLWVDDSTGHRYAKWFDARAAGCDSGSGICSVSPTTALHGGDATWRVRTWNADGSGPWSVRQAFRVGRGGAPNAATLSVPSATTVNDTTPTFSWNAVSGSTWYQLWVDDSSGHRHARWYKARDVGCPSGIGTCGVTPSTGLVSGSARWWVRTWNEIGIGPWSASADFTVVASSAGYPAIDVELCTLVNDYRAENGLSAVPLSRALMTTARYHALDYNANPRAYDRSCNLHSWGDPATSGTGGNWNACCYTRDHANAQCMWNKPIEITANWSGPLQPYTGRGYENSAVTVPDNAPAALRLWKNSVGHNALILNQNIWRNLNWAAMGCGSSSGAYHLIFSDTADPNPAP